MAMGLVLMGSVAAAAAPGRPEVTLGPAIAPFPECPNRAYMTMSPTGGQSTLSVYDISTATMKPIKDLTLAGKPIVVNAIGYSSTQKLFWAVRAIKNPPSGAPYYPDELVRIDSQGNVDDIGPPANLAALGYTDFLALAGTVLQDVMYVHTKVPANHIFQIDVNPSSPTLGNIISDRTLSRISPNNPDNMLNLGDWDYSDIDGQFYGIELAGGKRMLVKVNPADGVVTDVADVSADLPDSDNYGAVFVEDGTANVYTSANNIRVNNVSTGESQTFMVRADMTPPLTSAFAKGQALKINDGADCLLATDFGDAPSSFLTSDAEGGPAHVMSSVFNPAWKLWMGGAVDSDIDGFPSAGADSDDTNVPGVNDEDAVPAGTEINKAAPALTVKVTNTTGQPATLAGWLDANGNGTFETGERAMAAATDSTTLTWPAITTQRTEAGTQAMLRLRLFAGAVADPQVGGFVDGGEVEDHMVTLVDGPAPPVVAPNDQAPPADPAPPAAAPALRGTPTPPPDYVYDESQDAWIGPGGEVWRLPETGDPVRPYVLLGASLLAFGALVLGLAWLLGRRTSR